MLHSDIWNSSVWCLYDSLFGEILLKHPWRKGQEVPCPHCGKTLVIENYRAKCCDHEFKASFGEICQCEPVGKHNRKSGRGWTSIRPYKGVS